MGSKCRPKTLAAWNRLPAEAAALFGPARPYENYTFLLGLSNHIPRAGIEHHQSSDNRLGELALVKAAERRMATTLFPHEFVHAWNGKFRRPADMIAHRLPDTAANSAAMGIRGADELSRLAARGAHGAVLARGCARIPRADRGAHEQLARPAVAAARRYRRGRERAVRCADCRGGRGGAPWTSTTRARCSGSKSM